MRELSAEARLHFYARQIARKSGSGIHTVALYSAFAENRDLSDHDLTNAIQETVPLYDTYEDRIKELRDWARNRARMASLDDRMVDLFK